MEGIIKQLIEEYRKLEEVEAITPVDLLRRAGIEVKTVGITGKTVYGSHNIGIEADILPEEIDFDALDMIVLPGGLGGVASARASGPGTTAGSLPPSAPALPSWQTWASPTAEMPPAIPAARIRWAMHTWPQMPPSSVTAV